MQSWRRECWLQLSQEVEDVSRRIRGGAEEEGREWLFAVSPRGWIDFRTGCLCQSSHSKNLLIDGIICLHLPLLLSPSLLCCPHVLTCPSVALTGSLHCFSARLLFLPTRHRHTHTLTHTHTHTHTHTDTHTLTHTILSGSGCLPKSSVGGEIQPLLSYSHCFMERRKLLFF